MAALLSAIEIQLITGNLNQLFHCKAGYALLPASFGKPDNQFRIRHPLIDLSPYIYPPHKEQFLHAVQSSFRNIAKAGKRMVSFGKLKSD